MSDTEPEARVRAPSKARRIAFTACTVLFGLAAAGGLGFGLVIGWSNTESGGIHRVHLLVFGILYGVLLAVPLLAMARRADQKPSAFLQVVAIALAVLIAGLLSADSNYLYFALAMALGVAILLALHPARRSVIHPKARPSGPMAAYALACSVPLVGLGLTTAGLQRTGLAADPHVSQDHWATMAAMAFGLVLVGLLASARFRGWLLTAWCAGFAGALYGIASVVFRRFPGTDVPYPGSEGTVWGILAVLAGLGFVALAEWEARRAAAQVVADVPSGAVVGGS
jgi:hypothetical protein